MSITPSAPRASIVLAVLSPDPKYFPLALQSILSQTFTDFELIVVEDPSPHPAAPPYLASYPDRRIRHLVNSQRTSLVRQKNQGLALARAPLVAMFDADDVAEPDRLEKQVRYFEQHPDIDVLGGQIRIIDADGHCLGYRSFPLEHDRIIQAMHRLVPLSHPTVMLRTDVALAAGGYQFTEYPVAEDYELWSRLAKRGARFAKPPRGCVAVPNPRRTDEAHLPA